MYGLLSFVYWNWCFLRLITLLVDNHVFNIKVLVYCSILVDCHLLKILLFTMTNSWITITICINSSCLHWLTLILFILNMHSWLIEFINKVLYFTLRKIYLCVSIRSFRLDHLSRTIALSKILIISIIRWSFRCYTADLLWLYFLLLSLIVK